MTVNEDRLWVFVKQLERFWREDACACRGACQGLEVHTCKLRLVKAQASFFEDEEDRLRSPCTHGNIVSARNEVILSGLVCLDCGALFPEGGMSGED